MSSYQHSGPCIYCAHGPYCTNSDCLPTLRTDGPVCGTCRERINRAEIAADPYYRGDYLEMFGDDE
ncbi:MAG TPA: hypothetical protein VLW50_30530 [Streptosporangiaceae bacterium]|nr:hypothetical protein [Streptosporangiaceae bacterium]